MLSKVILVSLLACAAQAVLNEPCDPNTAGACGDVLNSICDPTSLTCVCDDRYLATSTGGCDGVIGRSCSIDFGATCNKVPYALCLGPTCECTNEYVTSDSKTACLTTVYNTHCLEDAQCAGLGESICVNERCVCKDGFVSNGKAECLPVATDLNVACTTDAQCLAYDPHAECIFTILGNRCRCRGGWVHNLFNNACIDSGHKVGDSCGVQEQCTNFNENAKCAQGQCVCNDGYVGSLDGVNCILQSAFGASCQQSPQCSSATSNSACIDGVCQCEAGFTYDGTACVAAKQFIMHNKRN
ncbi:Hypothetical predicted protein [Cloeon dipterum]|uniref:EB domain-containing protein n=1 Tax=Cloeon dipterum TaxID=197152 RepID=A0A8S1D499_9INSE|nr:Hypothetical predicted protein [Cloeon dipterum]